MCALVSQVGHSATAEMVFHGQKDLSSMCGTWTTALF